jgi:hypothetical protein
VLVGKKVLKLLLSLLRDELLSLPTCLRWKICRAHFCAHLPLMSGRTLSSAVLG